MLFRLAKRPFQVNLCFVGDKPTNKMSYFSSDNTGVIRMKRDFNEFVKGQRDSSIPSFSLDDSNFTDHRNSYLEQKNSMEEHSLIEKEKRFKAMKVKETETKSIIHKLEMKINNLETENKKQKLDYEYELKMLQNNHDKEKQKVSNLWSKIKLLTDKEEQLANKLNEEQAGLDQQRKKYEEQILSLQKKKAQLADDLQQEKENSWQKTSELKADLMRKETELKICQCDLEETRVQMKQHQQRSSELNNQMKDYQEDLLKLELSDQKIKDLERQLSKIEEDKIVSSGLKSQLNTFQEQGRDNRRLLDENQYLRDIQENNELLKEQHDSMRKKVERLEAKLQDYNKLLTDNEDLSSRLEKWENSGSPGSKLKSPQDLSKRLVELQKSEVIMLSKQGELQSNLHVKEKHIHQLQEEMRVLQLKVQEGKSKQQQLSDFMKRLQRKLLLVTKERDSYKSMVAMEMTPSKAESNRQTQITQLEESVRNYQQQGDHLESELCKVNEELVKARQQAKQFETRLIDVQQRSQNGQQTSDGDQMTILNLREKIVNLEKSLEKCETEKYTLECRIEQKHLQGDYDPTKLKVLHFKMNPADVAATHREHELKSLKEENERLMQRVKLLEENEGKMEDLTVVVEQKLREPGSSKDIEEIREQLKTAELKNKRLLEIFKKTSQEIREICYQLTGYKIDIHSPLNDQYRLTSMYAESSSDFLLFENSEGDIRLLGTEFSATLTDLIEVHLGQQNSIPAFLSNLTLDLFNRQSMMISDSTVFT